MRRFWRIVDRADVIKVSADDLDYLFADEQDAGVQRMIDAGVRLVLETNGGHAVRVHGLSDRIDVPVPDVDVVDTIGAGDSFGGAFAAWWDQASLNAKDLSDADTVTAAVRAAVEVAAINCTRPGADSAWYAELGDRWHPAVRP